MSGRTYVHLLGNDIVSLPLHPFQQLTTLYYSNSMKTIKMDINIREGYKGEWVVDLHWNRTSEIVAWCQCTFGPAGRNRKYAWRASWAEFGSWSSNLGDHRPRIFLRNKSDVALFKLKWS
jgi:hypothetical protein